MSESAPVEASGSVPVRKWRGTTPRTLEVDARDWAAFVASAARLGSSSAVEVEQFIEWSVATPGVDLPARFDVVVEGDRLGSGSTSVRVEDGLWSRFVGAARGADSSAAREVRGFVRWVLGRSGAREPQRLVVPSREG